MVLPLAGWLFFSAPLSAASPHWTIQADRVEISASDRTLRADGNVSLSAGESRLKASHMTVLLDRRVAQAWQGVTVDQDGLWASAQRRARACNSSTDWEAS
jgi:lipopolysaccharide export system protein LptA